MNYSKELKAVLSDLGITVYASGETPTSGNPDQFISIENNGSTSTTASQYGLMTQTLLVGIYTKLSATGIKNTVKEEKIWNIIFERFKDAYISNEYTFSLSKFNMFNDAKNIVSGYSTRFVNIISNYKN